MLRRGQGKEGPAVVVRPSGHQVIRSSGHHSQPCLDFDALAQDLARGVSRRHILGRLLHAAAAGLAAPLLGRLLLEPTPAVAATTATAPAGPCSSSSAGVCVEQAQTVLTETLAGCFPETADQASVAFWQAVDQCLGRAGDDYDFDRGQCLGPRAGCPAGSQCSNDQCCPPGQVGCGTVCCAAGESCVNGQCGTGTGGSTTNCPAGQTLCGSACVNLQTDPGHCGVCRRTCTGGETCQNGNCACPADRPTFCDGSCVNTQTNASHCGGCGKACPGGQDCVKGQCTSPCPAGRTACSGVCVNLQTSPLHCGACGTKCAPPSCCVSGQCTISSTHVCCSTDPSYTSYTICDANPGYTVVCCGGGCCFSPLETCCAGACVNLQTDKNNCGACGNRCVGRWTCASGLCVVRQSRWGAGRSAARRGKAV